MQALDSELRRLEETATYSAQSQFEQAKIWRGTNLVIGGPAAVLAAVAGASGLASATNHTTAAILALISAGLGGVVTSLNAASRASRAHSAANTYLAVQTEARQLRQLDLPGLDTGSARETIRALTAKITETNAAADIPARVAYWLGRRNIAKRRQTYEVDR